MFSPPTELHPSSVRTEESEELEQLGRELEELRARLLTAAVASPEAGLLHAVHPDHRASAENLVHYLALRRHDQRSLQRRLSRLGLTSLGRAEAHVLPSVDAARHVVAAMTGHPLPDTSAWPIDLDATDRVVAERAMALLGPTSAPGRTRIMVTLPSAAATDPSVVDALVVAGADLLRINCAHDTPDDWRAMVAHVRVAERRHRRRVLVLMDLAGPKVRTGPVAPAPGVVRVSPERDQLGRVVAPALVWLTAEADSWLPGAATIPVEDGRWLAGRRRGDQISFRDTRSSRRTMTVTDVVPTGVVAEIRDTSYLHEGIELRQERDGTTTAVAPIAPRQRKLHLAEDDLLLLVPDLDPADPSDLPARLGCTVAEVFTSVAVGDRVCFDDGRIEGLVEGVAEDLVSVRITANPGRRAKLGGGKGINLPDTDLAVAALSPDDLAALAEVVDLADVVGLSFVRSAEDVRTLHDQLRRLGGDHLGVLLKVETVHGFARLPEILLEAMRSPRVGVMIARGDLAVEAGYARLAEVQEEILWLCEAAHVPVVWATEVLDTLARTGRPSRAEVTDAAMAGRAECVMLNKGPFVADAVAFLDDVLGRMADHQRKKSPLLRRLRAWD